MSTKSMMMLLIILIVTLIGAGCATPPTPAPTQPPAKAPEPTKAPAPTTAPVATKAPEPTKAPAPTTAPAATKAPEPTKAAAPAKPKELRYGLTLVVSGIDPHVHSSSELGIPLTSVYDTLVYLTSDYKFVPGLAESWENPNATTYVFKLKKNVKFHDGTPFNAQAVKDNFDRIMDPATKSAKAITLLGPYKSTEVVDDFTVRVTFTKPYPSFFDSLASVYLGMASPTAFKKWGVTDYQMHQVGTGPFKFSEKEFVAKDTIVLEKNPGMATHVTRW